MDGTEMQRVSIHVTDPHQYNVTSHLKIPQAILFHHGKDFAWKSPPYEYEWENSFDLIVGDDRIRQRIARFDASEIQRNGQTNLTILSTIQKYHLYPKWRLRNRQHPNGCAKFKE
jgi:hypothetical protein